MLDWDGWQTACIGAEILSGSFNDAVGQETSYRVLSK
jgi:hypothetical protein